MYGGPASGHVTCALDPVNFAYSSALDAACCWGCFFREGEDGDGDEKARSRASMVVEWMGLG